MGKKGEKNPASESESFMVHAHTLMTHLLVLPAIYDSEKLYDCSEAQIDARKCFETFP